MQFQLKKKSQQDFFVDINKLIIKIIRKGKGTHKQNNLGWEDERITQLF